MKKILVLLSVTFLLAVTVMGCGSKTEDIDLPQLTSDLTFGDLQLNNHIYKVTKNKDEKDATIILTYESNVMIVGKVTKIRNTVVRELGEGYSKIDLTINQHDPMDSVNYTYEDGKWNKEVE